MFRGFFCRRTVGVNEHQLAPSVSGNVALLHVPLALADGEHGVGGFGTVAETRDVTVADVDDGFAVAEALVALHEQVHALAVVFAAAAAAFAGLQQLGGGGEVAAAVLFARGFKRAVGRGCGRFFTAVPGIVADGYGSTRRTVAFELPDTGLQGVDLILELGDFHAHVIDLALQVWDGVGDVFCGGRRLRLFRRQLGGGRGNGGAGGQ